ncbi:MAG: cyclase family protein, partial [Clostridia bacterium]
MKIDKLQYIDISEPIFNCTVYEGDTASTMTQVRDMSCGDEYNLTDVSMCLHNGTHIDAPSHFLSSGKTIDKLDLSLMCGSAQVVSADK